LWWNRDQVTGDPTELRPSGHKQFLGHKFTHKTLLNLSTFYENSTRNNTHTQSHNDTYFVYFNRPTFNLMNDRKNYVTIFLFSAIWDSRGPVK